MGKDPAVASEEALSEIVLAPIRPAASSACVPSGNSERWKSNFGQALQSVATTSEEVWHVIVTVSDVASPCRTVTTEGATVMKNSGTGLWPMDGFSPARTKN